MSDIVYIKNLEINTIIGIHDWERQSRQIVSIDLEMATDIHKAAESEDILLTIDYSAVSVRLVDFVQSSEFLLIETMAEKVAEIFSMSLVSRGCDFVLGSLGQLLMQLMLESS